ncbi:cytochrome c oxidase subunit II [Janthinobacterium psychrotolerans]|uniref:Cytochrome c oxidase subunit 2 n=1 Tax=Janthinobacterium psychrotolerans TaxID=1747903 RepID=A0A1A7BT41_9BURK|nr:c-type cytochrome [Janthinobacterium psychrotolerans]OBV36692.1 cytochrome c oxidase subunit 2 [Janthinobacterium psychrotolerans]
MSQPSFNQSALHPAGADAAIIHDLSWLLFIGASAMLLGVMVLLALALRRPGAPVRPLRWLAGGGVVLPLVVLTALLAWSTLRSAQLTRPSSQHAVKIAVTAKMWWWEVRYTDPASGRDIVLANEIRLPAGQSVYLGLASEDVIHSFWVPALAGKVDMLPGRLHGMTVRAGQPGVYRGQCAEYCGQQHARMALHVVVQTPEAFKAWLDHQSQPAATPAGALALRGRDAFVAQRCVACHTVRGVADEAKPGPDLTHVGSRLYLGAGTLRNSRGAMAGWIADPHASKPGVRMPAAGDLDSATLAAISAYLEQLQ